MKTTKDKRALTSVHTICHANLRSLYTCITAIKSLRNQADSGVILFNYIVTDSFACYYLVMV